MSNNETKTIESEKLERYADMFKALSNYHRLRIFLHTLGCYPPGDTCVTDASDISAGLRTMAKDLELAPSTVSHHLKELRNAGLLKMRRTGQSIAVWIDKETVEDLSGFIDMFKA